MYVAGRWASLELANTIFILWVVAVAVLGIVTWGLSRRRPPKSSAKEAVTRRRRGKRHER